MKLFIYCVVFSVVGASCHHKPDHEPYANNLHLQPAYLASVDTPNYTLIAWRDTVQDFGTIREGDSVQLKFVFKNVGNKPLLLNNARTSCGCTVTAFPQRAILPGEEDELVATFRSEGKGGEVHKSIIVSSNTKNGYAHVLTFSGHVERR